MGSFLWAPEQALLFSQLAFQHVLETDGFLDHQGHMHTSHTQQQTCVVMNHNAQYRWGI